MPKEMQEVELKLDLPQSTLPTSKITIENGSGSTVVVKWVLMQTSTQRPPHGIKSDRMNQTIDHLQ